MYAYTEQYIEHVLIPELEGLALHYDDLDRADSAAVFWSKMSDWEDALDDNRDLKANATKINNRSFSAGADFTFFEESGVTTSYNHTATFTVNGEGNLGGFEIGTPVAGFQLKILANYKHENMIEWDMEDTTGTTSTLSNISPSGRYSVGCQTRTMTQ